MKKSITILSLFWITFLSAQQYMLDFGTDTGTIACTMPYTGTTLYRGYDTIIPKTNLYDVRFITSNLHLSGYFPEKCQFDIKNPGDTSVGSGSEIQFNQGYYPDLRLQVSDFASTDMFRISFTLKINQPSSQHWSYPNITFYFGDARSAFFDKTRTPNFNNSSYPNDTMVFGAVHFRADGLLPNYYNAVDVMYGPNIYTPSMYYTWSPRLITQGVSHRIEIVANTSLDSVLYDSPQGTKFISGRHYEVYVDDLQVHGPMENQCYHGGNVSAFSWFVNQPNYFAPIILDDVEWSTDFSVTTLPVALTQFQVVTCGNRGNDVCLSWQTETEVDNDQFVIERSIDGVYFTPVGKVTGSGTSTVQHQYGYRDQVSRSGRYYYRLQQIDFDGTIQYSSIVSVLVGSREHRCETSTLATPEVALCVLYDLMGREIKPAGESLDPSIPRGMYVVVRFDGREVVCREKVWIE